MYKYLFALILSFTTVECFAQVDTLSQKDKAALDSMIKNDEFLKMLNDAPKNSFEISMGIGNGSFSEHNLAANATGVSNQVILTPAVAFRTKGGFSISVTGFITKDSSAGMRLYQTGISPGYDYFGDKVQAGISYTRFLCDKNKYNNKCLYQNDFYGYVRLAKGIVQPGIALGYANGNFKEVNLVLFQPQIGPARLVKDSTDNKASYFSITASAGHDFNFYDVLGKNDEFDFTPTVVVNAGSDKTTYTHLNRAYDRIPALRNRKKVSENNKMQLQSVGASFDFTYSIGKFFIQPNVYFDYYLPSTTSKRFTSIYSVAAGFSF